MTRHRLAGRLLASVTRRRVASALTGLLAVITMAASAAAQPRTLGREDIRLLGAGLRVAPARQTVPKDIASIVSTFLQAPTLPDAPLPPFAPDAVVKGTLRGPGFAQPREITARPNTPFNLPPFSVAGLYSLDNIRLESGGEVLLYATPESVTIEVIEKLLATQVTARPLTAAEIREKGIVFDKSNFQAYNFTAAFAVGSANPVPLSFPVVLPTLQGPADVSLESVGLAGIPDAPKLPRLETIIPDTLTIQTQIPNLSVVGFTLTVPELKGKSLQVPPIPGIVVIPGDIGFLNQFFNVTLLVGNVAPAGSNLVVSELRAEILLPPGRDNVANSGDDPLAMARTAKGESPRVQLVVQPGADGKLGTGDDIGTLAPGESGSAEYLVEGRREGTHVIEMQMTGTLTGLPVGPVTVTGRAAGTVLVRNPTFTLTFTHPDLINAGEPYTLDVTVTNTSESPANFVSVNLFPANVAGATLVGSPTREVESIAPGDSATVSFDLVSQLTGPVFAATLDSDDNVNGRFALKTSVGELGVPLSPDSLVLPKEARSLPADLRAAALGLLGKAWAVATAPAAALPPDVTRFSKQVVYDRGIELAEAGFRYSLGEPLPDSVWHLALDYTGNGFTRIPEKATSSQDRGFREGDARGFDELRRASVRGDVLASVIGAILGQTASDQGTSTFHRQLGEQATSRPAHVSVVVAGEGGASPFTPVVIDPQGRQLGGLDGKNKVVKQIPFGDMVPLTTANGAFGDLAMLSVPEPGEYVVRLATRGDGTAAGRYSVSVVLPDAQGRLRHVVFAGLGPSQLPAPVAPAGGPFRVRFEFAEGGGATTAATSDQQVTDPAPRVLSVTQYLPGDVIRCGESTWFAGRVVAVLFSEEVTKASVQDGLVRGQITAFRPEANEAVGVALQPGRRIAFVAMRDALGPFVPRSMTVEGVSDRGGNVVAAVTVPMQSTIEQEEQGGQVFGRVLYGDGTPAVGVDARLFALLGGCTVGISAKPTDGEGRFAWDFLLKDIYASRIVAVDPRTGDSRGLNFALQRNGQRLEVNVVFLGRGTVTGRALSETSQPLPGTSIRITSLTDRSQYGATADEAGAFSVAGVPVGNLLVEAVYVRRNAQGQPDGGAEVTVSELIPAAGAIVARDLVLIDDTRRPPTITFGSITGAVLRGDGTTPAQNVPVIAYYRANSQPGIACPAQPNSGGNLDECALAVVNTDADGRFAFYKLPSGQFRVETFDQTTYQQGEARAIVPASGTAAVTVLLDLGIGTVTGVVFDAQGQRVAGARVGGGLSIVTTDAYGTFALADVPVGRREIVAVSDALVTRGSTIVDLLRAGDTVNATIVLDPTGGIAGTATRANGTPAARATVYVFYPVNDGVRVIASTDTDAQGRYAFSGLALRADYRVSSFVAGFTEGAITEAPLKFANQIVRADLRLRGQGVVRGTLLRAEANGGGDTPLAGAVGVSGDQLVIAGGLVGVRFKRVDNFDVAETDIATGRFEFRRVWSGTFTLNAVGTFSAEAVSLDGTLPGAGAVVDVTLRVQPTSSVTGLVVMPDGVTPVGVGVVVRLDARAATVVCSDFDPLGSGGLPSGEVGDTECREVPQGTLRVNAVTDADGRFTMPIVGARAFTMTASDPVSGRFGTVEANVRPGDTADVTIRLFALPSSLTIRVRTSTLASVPGALVEVVQDSRRDENGDVVTDMKPRADANGLVVLTGATSPVEGEFSVRATDLAGAGFESGRVTGRIRAQDDGRDVTLDVFLFDQAGVVFGRVLRADGTTPVPNAEVVVSNDGGPLGFAVTDATGAYRVETVPLGPVYVDTFEAATGRRGFAQGSIDISGREIEINVAQYGVGLVKGQLLQTVELAPLKGWSVTLTSRLPSGRSLPQLLTTSDPNGRFYFPGVSTGPFLVAASRRGVAAVGHVSARLARDGQIVDLPIVIDIPRQQFGWVVGTVFNPDASRAAFAQVSLGGGQSPPTTTADAQGAFGFDNVPLGQFYVQATPQGGAPQVASAYGELLFENDLASVTLVLSGIATIEGTVVKADGVTPEPFANVVLTGQPFAGCERLSPVSCSPNPDGSENQRCLDRQRRGGCQIAADASGFFRFAGISARTFSVVAETSLGAVGQVGGALNPTQTLNVRVVLSDSSRVSGRVLRTNGQPLGLAVAEFVVPPQVAGQSDRLYVASAADGTFVFESIRLGGPFALTITDPLGDGVARRSVQSTGGAIDLGDIVLDDAPPVVTTTEPAPLSIGVPLGASLRIVFSEPINIGTINATNVVLAGPGGALPALLNVEAGDASVVVDPLASLVESARYTLVVKDVTDRFGKKMPVSFSTTFTAADFSAPAITQLSPAANASGVPVTSAVRVQYGEPINPAAFAGPPIVVSLAGQSLAGRTDYLFGNTVVVFTPTFPLADDTRYDLLLAGAADVAGNRAAPLATSFSTTDRTPPQIAGLTAPNGGRVIEHTVIDVTAAVGASDVAFVDFYVNGVLTFTDRLAPFVFPLLAAPSIGAPGAQVLVSAIATDTSGNRGTQPVGTTVEITADQAPTITITAPADGLNAANNQRMTLELSAADDVGLTHIGFRAETGRPTDTSTLAISPSATARTQTFAFNMPESAAPGAHVPVTATVRDSKGQTASATVALAVTDAVAPSVTITGTTSGTRVLPGSSVQVVVAATDAGGVRSVTFRATGAAGADETRTIEPALDSAAVAFTLNVPAAAATGQTINLDATATDRAGNTGTAGRLALAVADQSPPRLTLTTGNGRLEAVPGTTLTIVADAEDEIGVARITVRGDGAFTFSNGRSFSPALGLASAQFTVDVPAGAAPGSTLAVTASAVDLVGNTSDPVTLLLPVRTVSDVTVDSVLMLAGERAQVPVTLGTAAPAGGLTLTFTSRNANVAQPVTGAITIPEGQTASTLLVDGVSGGTVQIDVFAQSVLRTTFTATVRGGIVQGVVRGLDGQPAVGIDVSVVNGDQTLSTSSGADGKYFFEGIDRQNTVEVKADDPNSRLIGFARGPMNRLNGFVTLDIDLVEAGRITGVVKKADGTLAGADALVQLYRSSTGGLVSTVFTDAESRFQFPLVELASYRIDASRLTTGDKGRTTASVDESGDQVTANVTFLGRGVVTGTVRSGGVALPNLPITIHARNVFDSTQTQTNADPQGVYRLEGVLAGSVSVSTRDEGTDRYASASGTLDTNGQTLTLDLALEDYATLRGQVRRADNVTPVPGARVDVGGERVTADENGNYVVPFLPLRAYTIVATDLITAQSYDLYQSAIGAVTGRATVDLSQAAHRSTVTRDVVLLPVGSIVATVLDGTGQPAANATVTVITTSTAQGGTQTQRREARTDASGLAIIDQVIAGSYSARALKSSLLTNTVTGTLTGGAIAEVQLTLAPTATIAGTLTGPDGQTPFAGGHVSLGLGSVQVGADGRFSFPGLALGSYRLYGYDASRRLRAYLPTIVLDTANATRTIDVALAGLGTVSGRVTGPTTGPGGEPLGEPGITVTLQSFAPFIGGTYSAVTNGAGFYAIPDVVSGSFRLSVFDPARQLAAEATGEVPALGGDVAIDLALVSNSVTMATTLYDANGQQYSIRDGAELFESSNRFRNALDVVLDGTPARFTGAQFGTQEDGGRERAVRQTIGPLSITRKIYVPAAYFGRYLDTFTNTGAAPVTFDVRLTSTLDRFTAASSPPARATSSGDTQFGVGGTAPDRYLVTMRDASAVVPPAGTNYPNYVWAFDGEGAQAGATAASVADRSSNVSDYVFGWTLTLQPGETASLLHFTAIAPSQAAGVGTAERLLQVPPEALQGLNAIELQSIRNFVVPQNGLSALDPLPALDGTVSGLVLEFDGTTPTPRGGASGGVTSSSVRFRPTLPYFAWWRLGSIANTAGAYSFTSRLDGSSSSVAIPLAPFEVEVVHPWSGAVSPRATGDFAPDQNATTQNVVFDNTSIVTGTVRRHTGTAVAGLSGTVTLTRTAPSALTIANVAIDTVDGTYRVFGVPQGTYTFASTVTLTGIGTLTGSVSAPVTPDQPTAQDIILTATGTVTGTLTSFSGAVAPAGRQVLIGTPNSSGGINVFRTVVVGAAGAFAFPEMPVGTWILQATDPATNFTRRVTDVVVAADQTTVRDVVYVGPGSIRGVLSDMDGNPVPAGRTVTIYRGSTLSGGTGVVNLTTTTGGAFVFGNLYPYTLADTSNYTYNLTAQDPSTLIRAEVRGIVVGEGQEVVQNLQYVGAGSVSGVTRRAVSGGDPVAVGGASVVLRQGTTTVKTATSSTAPATLGAFTLTGVVPGSYTLRGTDPSSGAIMDVPITMTAGQAVTQDIIFPATGSINVTVTYDGTSTPVGVPATIRSCVGTTCTPNTIRGTTTNGTLTIADQQVGSHVVRASHPNASANSADVTISIPSATTPGVANLSIAPVGTLTVTVLDVDGAPVVGSEVSVTSRNAFGRGSTTGGTTNTTGQLAFPNTFGDYTATATLPGSGVPVASATGRITQQGSTDNAITLRLPRAVQVTGQVRRANGDPDPDAYLEMYAGEQYEAYPTVTAAGAFTVPAVPVGQKGLIYAFGNAGDVGVVEFTIPADAVSPYTLDVVLDDVRLSTTLVDGNGRSQVVIDSGEVQPPGSPLGRSRSRMMARRGADFYGTGYGLAARELAGRQLVLPERIGASAIPGLWQTRRVYVPADGYFVRHLDVFENASSQPLTLDLVLWGWSVSAYGQGATVTSSGDASLSSTDRWIAIDGTTGTRTRLSQVFAGAGGLAPTTSDLSTGSILHTWSNITIPAGGRVAFLSFGGEHRDLAAAQGAAQRLVQLPPEALVGLTDEDRVAIVNFVVPAQGPVAAFPTVSGKVTYDGSAPVANAPVTVTAANPFLDAPRTVSADEGGDYSTAYPVVGAYAVTAVDPTTQVVSPATSGTLAPGQTAIAANVSFAGTTSGTLSGTVFSEGVPVGGVTVTLRRTGDEDRTRTTAANGSFSFLSVPAAFNYRIDAVQGALSSPLVFQAVTGGVVNTRDLHLRTREGTLTVRVEGADGVTGISNVQLLVQDAANNGHPLVASSTNDAGEAALAVSHAHLGVTVTASLRLGATTLEASANGGFAAVGSGQTAAVTLQLPVGVVTGRVLEADATTPVDGAGVTIRQASPDGQVFALYGITGPDGRYRVGGVLAGPVAVTATHPNGVLVGSAEGVVDDVASGPVEVDVVLPQSASIRGVIRNANGSLAANAGAYVVSTNGAGGTAAAFADGSGTYRVDALPLGTFTAQFCDENQSVCSWATGELTTPGQELVIDTQFPPATGSVSGRAVLYEDEEGGAPPAEGAEVTIDVGQWGPYAVVQRVATADENGEFTVTGVPLDVVAVAAVLDGAGAQQVGVLTASRPLLSSELDLSRQEANDGNVELPTPGGFSYLVGYDGSIGEVVWNGDGDEQRSALTWLDGVRVNGNPVGNRPVRSAFGPLVRFGPTLTAGLLVSRQVSVVASSSTLAIADIFSNTTSQAITVDVDLESYLATPVSAVRSAADSGGRYVVTTSTQPAPAAVLSHVFGGNATGVLRPTLVRGQSLGMSPVVRFRLTVPAGQQRVIVHAITQFAPGDTQAAIDAAEALAADPAALFFGLESLPVNFTPQP